MAGGEPLLPKHGGYRGLKSFQMAQLVFDLTVRFCDRYIDKRSRTHDQMVQAARSGVQNIAEGSQASGTSKKFEIKLTNVARASLEELRLDYEDFLRQRNLPQLVPEHPALQRFRERRCSSLEEVRSWLVEEKQRHTDLHRLTQTHTDRHGLTQTNTDVHRPTRTHTDSHSRSVSVSVSPCESVCLSSPALAANAALSLLNLCCYLLDRQIAAQAASFENEGGFTERLYRVRKARRIK
jgi:four helix bundle suffix protein